jgi:hypothetical protein
MVDDSQRVALVDGQNVVPFLTHCLPPRHTIVELSQHWLPQKGVLSVQQCWPWMHWPGGLQILPVLLGHSTAVAAWHCPAMHWGLSVGQHLPPQTSEDLQQVALACMGTPGQYLRV